MTTNTTVEVLNTSTADREEHGIGGETNIPGIVAVVLFYIAILAVGILAGRKTAKSSSKNALLIADRSIGLWVSILTFTGNFNISISIRKQPDTDRTGTTPGC